MLLVRASLVSLGRYCNLRYSRPVGLPECDVHPGGSMRGGSVLWETSVRRWWRCTRNLSTLSVAYSYIARALKERATGHCEFVLC